MMPDPALRRRLTRHRPLLRMTPGRRAWLRQLIEAPGTDARGHAVRDCMILGWCCHAYRLPHSDILLTREDLVVMFGPDDWQVHVARKNQAGMVITNYGRQALERWPGA